MSTYRITADLDATSQAIAAHLASAAMLANNLAVRVLVLSNDDLAAWLNSMPAHEVEAHFTAHATLGEALNIAAAAAQNSLAQWGVHRHIAPVDVRPVVEKLSDQHRTIELTPDGWVVTDIPRPEPEPEPEPDALPEE